MNPDSDETIIKAREKETMDQIQAELNSILRLNPNELTVEQRGFLTARRDYLNDRDLETFRKPIELTLSEAQAKLDQESGKEIQVEAPKEDKKTDKK